jgi:hypothetical protein
MPKIQTNNSYNCIAVIETNKNDETVNEYRIQYKMLLIESKGVSYHVGR